jgi:sarcosine oxidase subunit alpha
MPERVTLTINGREVSVPVGSMVSAAIVIAGHAGFRRSVSGEPRGPLCGLGVCFECRVTVDRQQHVRACQRPVCEGMEVSTND